MKYGNERLFDELQKKEHTHEERMKLIAETTREEDVMFAARRKLKTRLWAAGYVIFAVLVVVGSQLGWFQG